MVFVYFKGTTADRTSLKIYEDIQSDLFCFRRLNATHQIGCACKLFNLNVLYSILYNMQNNNIQIKYIYFPI